MVLSHVRWPGLNSCYHMDFSTKHVRILRPVVIAITVLPNISSTMAKSIRKDGETIIPQIQHTKWQIIFFTQLKHQWYNCTYITNITEN